MHKIKITFLSITILLISVCSFGQSGNKLIDKGYHGEISVSTLFGALSTFETAVSTTQSYNFGNGFSLGGGVGIEDFNNPSLYVYMDASYYFDRNQWYPYGRAKLGIVYGEFIDDSAGVLFVPEIGIGKGRFTLGAGLAYNFFLEAVNIVRPQLSLSFHF